MSWSQVLLLGHVDSALAGVQLERALCMCHSSQYTAHTWPACQPPTHGPSTQHPPMQDHECPICFHHFPTLNSTTCCNQSICTECFLKVSVGVEFGVSVSQLCGGSFHRCYSLRWEAGIFRQAPGQTQIASSTRTRSCAYRSHKLLPSPPFPLTARPTPAWRFTVWQPLPLLQQGWVPRVLLAHGAESAQAAGGRGADARERDPATLHAGAEDRLLTHACCGWGGVGLGGHG